MIFSAATAALGSWRTASIRKTRDAFQLDPFLLVLPSLAVAPAAAQRRQATPEQRIDRLEKQVRQVQGQVFPKGQPADTAGFIDDPAATQAQVTDADHAGSTRSSASWPK